MTARIYYNDSYLTDFSAHVIDRQEAGRRLYLDRTAFYPASGGQPFDTGLLGGARVVEVVDEGERVAHLVDVPIEADQVEGRIDWARRFDHMQQHTGQHLLSAILADRFGYQTVAVHFGAESSSLDLDTGSLAPAEVRQVEGLANTVVQENRPVTVTSEDAATAAGLRKASERSGILRIVTIDRIDRSACGGTHVRSTGELGAILIRGVERVKKQARVQFLCGGRAIRRAVADHDLLSQMAESASSAIDDLGGLILKQRSELKTLASSVRALESDLHRMQARELYHATAPDNLGRRVMLRREAIESIDELRGLAQAAVEQPKAIFVGTLSSPPTVLLAASADSGQDAGAVLKPVLIAHAGRGGGSARLAQGTVETPAQLDAAVAQLLRTINPSESSPR